MTCACGTAYDKAAFFVLLQGVEVFTRITIDSLQEELCARQPATSIRLWKLATLRAGRSTAVS